MRLRKPIKAARAILKKNGVAQPPVDVTKLAQEEGAKVVQQVLDDETSGFLLQKPNGTVFIAVNRFHHTNRQRFTVAHELGHLMLHQKKQDLFVDGPQYHFRNQQSAEGIHAMEMQANSFAAELLMPDALIAADMKNLPSRHLDDEVVESLAQRYEVSVQAMSYRLVNLGYVEFD